MENVEKTAAKPVKAVGGRRKGSKKVPGSGRAKGTQNKVNLTARAAIAKFVEGNTHRLQHWLDKVADGLPAIDKEGNPVIDQQGKMVFMTQPNPEKAFNLFQSVVEYHIPKLARTEIAGDPDNPLHTIESQGPDLSHLSAAELEAIKNKLYGK